MAVVQALGPNKSPGPDGFNAIIIQERWEVFGLAMINKVREFFNTGIMKSQVARLNLVLI